MVCKNTEPPKPPDAVRSGRVLTLLSGFVVLSLVDLLLTIGFMSTVGMFEDNPLVRLLIEHTGSVHVLIPFKLATVAAAFGILYAIRNRMQAEIGAWLAVGVLAAVTVQWSRYADLVAEGDLLAAPASSVVDSSWVRLETSTG